MVFIFFWDKSIKIQFILNIYFLKKKKKVINIFQLKTANILLGQIIKKIKVWKKHEVKKKNEAQGYDIYSKNTGLEQSVIFIHHVFSLNHSLYSRTKAGVNVRLIDGRCHYVRSLNWNNTMIITVSSQVGSIRPLEVSQDMFLLFKLQHRHPFYMNWFLFNYLLFLLICSSPPLHISRRCSLLYISSWSFWYFMLQNSHNFTTRYFQHFSAIT